MGICLTLDARCQMLTTIIVTIDEEGNRHQRFEQTLHDCHRSDCQQSEDYDPNAANATNENHTLKEMEF